MRSNHDTTEDCKGLVIIAAVSENRSCQGIKMNTLSQLGPALACFNTCTVVNTLVGVECLPLKNRVLQKKSKPCYYNVMQ